MNSIQIDIFNPDSIDNAIRELKAYEKSIETRASEVTDNLAQVGVDVAKPLFEAALATYDYDANVSVKKDITKNGHKVVAHSDDVSGNYPAVAFLEFGAGDKKGWGHTMAYSDDPHIQFGPGTFNPASDAWKYGWTNYPGGKGGKLYRTVGNPPARGMLNAMIEIYASAESVIRSIFK